MNLFEGRRSVWHPILLILGVALLGLLFAQVEIQVEGQHGWASGLKTWRIEHSIWLDIFWGGRPMTGYHAWIFTFMAVVFHLPIAMTGEWSWKLEARMVGSVMLFWIIEDFEWFVLNANFGLQGLNPRDAWWHKHWFFGIVPLDYVTFSFVGALLIWYSFHKPRPKESADATGKTPPADL